MTSSSGGHSGGGHGRVDGSGGSVIDHRPPAGGGGGIDHRPPGSGGGVIVYPGAPWTYGDVYVPANCIEDPDDPDVCIDDRPIVGHPRALRYGTWGAPTVLPHTIIEFGANYRHFADPGMTRSFGRTLKFGGTGVDHGASGVVRAGFGGKHLYGLAELEIGGLTAGPDTAALRTTESSLVTTTVGYAGVIGVAEPVGSHSRLALEGAFGGRTLLYSLDRESTLAATVPVVEARVRAETWLNPWTTVGVAFGSSVIEKNDWMAGAYVGFHTRAFGGER